MVEFFWRRASSSSRFEGEGDASFIMPKNFDQKFGTTKDEVPDSIKLKAEILLVIRTSLHPALLVTVALSAAITALITCAVESDSIWLDYLSSSKPAIAATLGAFLALSLAFRTNVCYQRWWEGRCLWGKLIYASIHCAQQSQSWIKNREKRERFQNAVITFAWACKAQLRGRGLHDEVEEGKKLIRRGVLFEKELEVMASEPGWQPYYCLDVMRCVFTDFMQTSESRLYPEQLKSMEDSIRDMAISIGGLIRLKNTGLPTAYDSFYQTAGLIFLVMASFAWSPEMGWYTPPTAGVITLVFLLMTKIGEFMVDPFGNDMSDLPLKTYCKVTEIQIKSIMRRERIPYDLGVGPIDEDGCQGESVVKSKSVNRQIRFPIF